MQVIIENHDFSTIFFLLLFIFFYYHSLLQVRSFYKGDTRAAVVPFLAYKEVGDTFKWLFYGDDDTVFFIDAAIRMV